LNLKNHTSKSYSDRIHEVIDYINAHLSEEIKLETIASVACFSPFHFHRIFTAFTNETPHQYIERRRMEAAAKLLYTTTKSVTEIASVCGFSTTSAFSRTFKKHFDIPPSKFLQKHINESYHHSTTKEKSSSGLHKSKMKLPVRIEHLPTFHVAYTQTLNGYANGIPSAWKKLLDFAQINQLFNKNTKLLGIPYDNPSITPKQKCQYRACITVQEDYKRKQGKIRTKQLEAGIYAVFHFEGTRQDISEAYAYIYGDWLPESGNIPDEKPLLEIYLPELFLEPYCEVLKYDIALPITSL
jgi:AraC family transcriptional regulator